MTSILVGRDEIMQALRQRMRVGEGLSMPYARKWSIGGCDAEYSLWEYPNDSIATFADGLLALRATISAAEDCLVIDGGGVRFWVAVNGRRRNAEQCA